VTAGVFHPSQLTAALVVASVFLEVVVVEEELHASHVAGSTGLLVVVLLVVVVEEEDQPAQSSRFQLAQVLVGSTGLVVVVVVVLELVVVQPFQPSVEALTLEEEELELVLAAGVV